MELNREELGIIIRLLNEKLETVNDGVATMDDATFKAMRKEEDGLNALHTKIRNEIRKIYDSYEDEEITMFGTK